MFKEVSNPISKQTEERQKQKSTAETIVHKTTSKQ